MASVPPFELEQPHDSELDEMLAGKIYDASDPQLEAMRVRAADLCSTFNSTPRSDASKREHILNSLLPHHGEGLDIAGPIAFDYGCHTTFGDRVYANFNLTILDCAPVTIGSDVLFGPNVSLLPASHPIRWQDRNMRRRDDGSYYDYEFAKPITIGSNCWFGGNVTVIGGVTIGDGCVIGAGSVVTRDIPANSVAVGNPARVIRTIGDADAAIYQEYAQ